MGLSELNKRHVLRGQAHRLGGVGLATALRFALELAWPGVLVPFATYFPAIVAVGYFGGAIACGSAIVLSILAGWFFSCRSPTASLSRPMPI